MTLIESTISKEKQRIEYMLENYQNQIKDFPKGAITKKHCGSKTYYYLKQRNGDKVVSKYVSNSDIEKISAQLDQRKHIETMIKELRKELIIANKALEGKR